LRRELNQASRRAFVRPIRSRDMLFILHIFIIVSAFALSSCESDSPPQKVSLAEFIESNQSLSLNADDKSLAKQQCWCTSGTRQIKLQKIAGMKKQDVDAIIHGLNWLAKNQDEDGGWGKRDIDIFGKSFAGNEQHRDAITSLALINFLKFCPYRFCTAYPKTIQRAIEYLTKSKADKYAKFDKEGRFTELTIQEGTEFMHAHCLRASALCIAYTIFKENTLKEYAVKATKITLDGQHESGGWSTDFNKAKDAKVDLVVSSWAFQNLYHFALSGLMYPIIDESCDDGVDYIKGLHTSGGGFKRFLSDNESQDDFTGAGVYWLQIWKNAKSKETKSGLEKILNERLPIIRDSVSSYEGFFNLITSFNATGVNWVKYWRKSSRHYYSALVDAQSNNGSWPPGSTHDHETQLYRTNLFLHSLILVPLSHHSYRAARYLK
jgi:hypothetical protein